MSLLTPACATGAVFAVLYLTVAIYIIRSDRRAPGGFLRGLGSLLAVLPVTAVVKHLGSHLDYRNNRQMVLSVSLTAILVYGVGLCLGAAIGALFACFVA